MMARGTALSTAVTLSVALFTPMAWMGSPVVVGVEPELWVNVGSKSAHETGTREAPYRSLGRALANAPAACVLRVASGEYREHVTLRDGITLKGEGSTRPVVRGADRTRPTVQMSGTCAMDFIHVTGGGDGIVATLGSKVRIVRCEVVNPGGDGIHFEKHRGGTNPRTEIHIEDCYVSGARDGIDVEGNKGQVIRSRLIGNTDDGLDYDGDTDFAALDNDIRDNFDDGIEIRLQTRTRARIEHNVILGNGEDGIEVIDTPESGPTANEVTISENMVRANRRYGISAVNQGTEDIKQGLEIHGIRLGANSVAANLKDQIVGVTTSAVAMENPENVLLVPVVVTERPVYTAYLAGPGRAMGRAELQYNIREGQILKKKLRLTVMEGPADAKWDVAVDGTVVGRMTLGDGGGMDLEWATKHGSFPASFPSGAGPGSKVTIGPALSGTFRKANDDADAALKARWEQLEAARSTATQYKPDESTVQRIEYVAYLAGASGSGKAELYYKMSEGRALKKQFQVTITGGTPGETWDVSVDGRVIGQITLGSGGGMQMEWSTKYGSFPANFPHDVRVGSVIALGQTLSGTLETRTAQVAPTD